MPAIPRGPQRPPVQEADLDTEFPAEENERITKEMVALVKGRILLDTYLALRVFRQNGSIPNGHERDPREDPHCVELAEKLTRRLLKFIYEV